MIESWETSIGGEHLERVGEEYSDWLITAPPARDPVINRNRGSAERYRVLAL